MSGHRVLRFVFSIAAALIVFAVSTSSANASTDIYNNSLDVNCPPYPSSFGPGSSAWVSDWNPKPLIMYERASYGSARMQYIATRESVDIFSGPMCVQGDIWLRIAVGNTIGYAVAVNKDGSYNLIPNGIGHDVSPINDTTCPPSMTSLMPGDTAWISDWNQKPLTMYAKAAYGSFRIGDYPTREVVTIRSKPICHQGDAWIRVEYWGNQGWMVAVNRDGSYNLIPVKVAGLTTTYG